MNDPYEGLDPRLIPDFERLSQAPQRNPQAAAAGRAAFIAQAETLKAAVSPAVKARHTGWISIFYRKEPYKMTTLSTLLLIVSLFLGGTGATVAAAQTSLPDQPLYAVKLVSEDVRSGLTAQEQSRLNLELEFANLRVNEVEKLASSGSTVPQTVLTRYQQELENALAISAGMDDTALQQALLRIQARLQTQLAALDALPAAVQADPAIARIRAMLTERLQWVEAGLADPQAFRSQFRQGRGPAAGYPAPGQTGTIDPTMTRGAGNPYATGTPTPGSGYGPGPGPDPTRTCTPGSGNGPMPTHEPEHMATTAHTDEPGHNGMGPQPTQPAATAIPQHDPGGMGPGPMATHEPETGSGGTGGSGGGSGSGSGGEHGSDGGGGGGMHH
jgi:uncharacterized membrane protein YgcG